METFHLKKENIKTTATMMSVIYTHAQAKKCFLLPIQAEISVPSLSQTIIPFLHIHAIDFSALIQPDWFIFLASCKRLIKSSKTFACTNNFKKYFLFR